MKRFWTDVEVVECGIRLDGRPVRTPARAPLMVPTEALARAIGDEWSAVGEEIDPRAMPLTGLANAAIDQVTPDPSSFSRMLALYGATDLLCYRAEAPEELVSAQAAAWDPLLDWARGRYDVHFAVTAGVMHVSQPGETITRLNGVVDALPPFRLAGLQPLVTIGGSLIIALAVLDGAYDPGAAFTTASLDELWQAEQWGEDALATETRVARRRDWDAAARFLDLLG